MAFVYLDETNEEVGTAADSVERGLLGAIGGEGVVVAIKNGDSTRQQERFHGGRLLCVGSDGEEALEGGVFL